MKHQVFTDDRGRRTHDWQLVPGGPRYAFAYDATQDERGSGARLTFARHLRHIRRQVPDILRRAAL